MHTILQPEGWAKPIGYSNGVAASGRTLFVGGQMGVRFIARTAQVQPGEARGRQHAQAVIALGAEVHAPLRRRRRDEEHRLRRQHRVRRDGTE